MSFFSPSLYFTVRTGPFTLVTASPTGRGRDLMQLLAAAELWPDVVRQRQRNLEEIFLSYYSDTDHNQKALPE